MIVVPLALFLIFVLLYTAFNAVKPAILIYLNVPVAVSGGIIALFVRDMPFSISAGIGFIALFGVAVMNGVVLISHMAQLRSEGISPLEAALRGAEEKLRAMIMAPLGCGPWLRVLWLCPPARAQRCRDRSPRS